jgi:hypothetical protein
MKSYIDLYESINEDGHLLGVARNEEFSTGTFYPQLYKHIEKLGEERSFTFESFGYLVYDFPGYSILDHRKAGLPGEYVSRPDKDPNMLPLEWRHLATATPLFLYRNYYVGFIDPSDKVFIKILENPQSAEGHYFLFGETR